MLAQRLGFMALALVFSCDGSYEGTREIPLSCCGEPKVEFEKGCDIHASVNEQAFAWFAAGVENGPISDCTSPCKYLKEGLMTLDRCMDVNVSVFCIENNKVISDVTQVYIKQTCNGTGAPRPDLFGLLVLLMILCCTWLMMGI